MPAPAPARSAAPLLLRLTGVVCAAAAAFSAAQAPPASEAPVPGAPPAVAAAPGPPPAPIDIALVLPLEAPAYSRAADAVRAGFLAAAQTAGSRAPRTKVFAHGEDGVLPAIEAAQAAGAKVIVGPLTRDDVRVVASMALELPYTIVLNQLDDGAAAPPRLYTFALAIDSDARLIARRVRTEAPAAAGTAPAAPPNVVVVSADTPLMKRFAGAFASEWTMAGGAVPDAYRFEPTPGTMTSMRRELNRRPPAAVLLALDGAGATYAKPYLGTLPAYASGLVFERETLGTERDLDGLMLVEIPWIVDPGAPQFAALPRRDYASAALTRLYALGLDAFRVAQAFTEGPPERFALDGATGRVTLVDNQQFAREGRLAVFRTGELVPLDAPR
ncbi:MAG: penicillin-binding protein activator [Betaproteobacteria bacterium]|nr:penicillin-binding protein activator [Betaproteobacteria bacterium]